MKLNNRTTQILKNFSTINPSIVFKPGKHISTISQTKTIMAKAKIDQEFESTFGIYDLSRFLGTVSLFNEPELEINDKFILISEQGKSFKYTVTDTNLILTPPEKEIKFPEPEVVFTLKPEVLNEVQKALSISSLPEIAVTGEEGNIFLQAIDVKNPTGDIYSVCVGETDKSFRMVFKAENIKVLQDTYNVSISSKGLAHFVGSDLEYYIAVEQTSKYNG